jgi:plasmid stabilization system protein ParE
LPRLIWTPPRLSEVHRLYHFLALDNPDAARRAVKAIRTGVKILGRQPQLRRPTDNLDPEFREWLIDCGNMDISLSISSSG